MGKVIILTDTTDIPITQIGEMASVCVGSDMSYHEENYKRGLNCIRSNHGRVMEYTQIYMEISDYSARVIREFGRHVGGLPTYLQESTRYVSENNFKYIVPPQVQKNQKAQWIYNDTMSRIKSAMVQLEQLGINREDISMLLPFSSTTKIIYRTNLRGLIDMAHQRLCMRAYWEYRILMQNIIDSLAFYSDEWDYLVNKEKIFVPKCKHLGFCPEIKSCGYYPKKKETIKEISIND